MIKYQFSRISFAGLLVVLSLLSATAANAEGQANTPAAPAAAKSPASSSASTSVSAPLPSASVAAPASAAAQPTPAGTPTSPTAASASVSVRINPLYTAPCQCSASLPPGAQPPQKKKSGHKVLKGIGHELGMEMGDLGKDMFLAFSVSGKDPYEMPDHPDIPYVSAEAQFIDGSWAHLIKYPDGSYRVQNGFLDGTYACPQDEDTFIVQYTNGARGLLKRVGSGVEIHRPDNTVTTVTPAGSAFRISNNKLGYMGDITPDSTGLSYEFAKQNF